MRRPAVVLLVIVLGLLAAGAALSSTEHRSGCHAAHSCPSDHHSYVWYDAAGQGWDCAEPGAPEVTAADTQSIYYDGLRYLCHRAGGTQTPTCGVEGWAMKTLRAGAATRIDYVPRISTVAALSAIPAPAQLGTRTGAELSTWRITVRLLWQKVEEDSDIHLVVADANSDATMIVELPAPGCVGAAPERVAEMSSARAALGRYCGPPTTSFMPLRGTATIDGVAYFDFPHLQRGRAPNLVELHPVLRFSPGRSRC
jgi:hypothetical protein